MKEKIVRNLIGKSAKSPEKKPRNTYIILSRQIIQLVFSKQTIITFKHKSGSNYWFFKKSTLGILQQLMLVGCCTVLESFSKNDQTFHRTAKGIWTLLLHQMAGILVYYFTRARWINTHFFIHCFHIFIEPCWQTAWTILISNQAIFIHFSFNSNYSWHIFILVICSIWSKKLLCFHPGMSYFHATDAWLFLLLC